MNVSTQEAADVLVVGGGIHGCSSAFHLARQGVKVILLEADYCGRHASGVNAGGVRTLGRPIPEIPLALASRAIWHELDELVGDDAGFEASGQLKVAESEADMQELRARVQALQSLGFSHEVLVDRETVRELVPTMSAHVVGGIWVKDDGHALPFRAVTAFRRAAERLGVAVHEGTPAEGMERVGGLWRVTTKKGVFEAKHLVNAAGAWSARIAAQLGEKVPVQPGGLMLMVTQRVPPFIKPVLGATSRPLSFKQFDNGTVVIGGALHCAIDFDAQHGEIDFSTLARSARTVTDLFPFLKDVQINRAWSGIEGFLPDKLPVIGPSKAAPDVTHVFGFCASGFQLGPASGRTVAELVVNGRTDVPIDAFAVNRFH
ncbi:FAD-binding oxidoreductase [Oxalobacteraceae bacterium OM1]|nr:FAD-binding oxidoreductase [Oxalobacteraceae bacterium OM1]